MSEKKIKAKKPQCVIRLFVYTSLYVYVNDVYKSRKIKKKQEQTI